MVKFREVNVNPKKRKTGDCSTRAIVGTLGISYEEALALQYKWALKTYYDDRSKQVIEKLLGEFGYIKMKQPKKQDGRKYIVGEMDKILTKKQMNEGVLISISNHITCIKDGMVQDLWDCREKTVCNYYIKK